MGSGFDTDAGYRDYSYSNCRVPAIRGWQIDNELNCEVSEFYSDADSEAFRVFLKEKYKTLDALNEAWGTVFWNQTYTQWEQIYVPRPTLSRAVNPHMHLDYYRFISHSTLSYCSMQAEIIRKYKKPEDFVMTNGMFDHVDNHRMNAWMYICMILTPVLPMDWIGNR